MLHSAAFFNVVLWYYRLFGLLVYINDTRTLFLHSSNSTKLIIEMTTNAIFQLYNHEISTSKGQLENVISKTAHPALVQYRQ